MGRRPWEASGSRMGAGRPGPAQPRMGSDSTHGRPQDLLWVTLQEKQERAVQLNLRRRKQARRGEGAPGYRPASNPVCTARTPCPDQ